MKKIFLLVIVSLLFITDTYSFQCDQTFYWKLRYWYQYTFYDDFSNTLTSKWINSVDVNYIEQQDYNGSSSFPAFSWTPWIIWKWYILNPGDSWTVIKASSTYPINYHPTVRNNNNFVIQYKAKYYEQINWVWNMASPKYHTECKYYEVTWCWDWVLDSDEWEICDPNDPNKSWWWTWGCNVSTCKPITTPNPSTCNSLWMNPTTWTSPLASNVSCLWTNANKYTINCWNGQTIDWSSGTCNYTWTWTFISTCYVNDIITSPSCQRTVNVSNPILEPSILLVKTDINPNDIDWVIWNDTQTVNVWSWAIFKITVTNNGTEDLNNIVISDTLAPNCSWNLTLPWTKPATWLNFTIYGSWNNSDNIFQVGESFSYNCEKSNTQTNYTNTASVNWKWVTSLKDVNDDDTSEVIIKNLNTPTCNSLTATPLTWVNSLTSTLTCTWTNATTYSINCWNWQVINASTGTCNYTTIWTYTPTCFINWNVTSSSCQQTVSVTNSTSSSSSSWGWDWYQCRDISKTWNQITCTWNHLVKTFRLSCNWSYLFANANVWAWNTTSANFTCNDWAASCSVYNQVVSETSFYTWLSNPACNLIPSSSSSSWWSTSSSWWSTSSSSSWWSSPDYCWDWVVQRPNDNFQNEECDFWTSTRPSWCTSSCKINWISSIPNDWEIVFWPIDNVIIGNNMNPYSAYSLDKPSILNNSSYDLYFDSLCVTKKSWSTINWATVCENIWKTLFPWVKHSFSSIPNFVWNTSSLTAWTYWDNVIVTTIEHEWVLYKDAYFASELKVRVSKPSVATTGGWTSFVKTTSNIANISDVTSVIWTSNKNKNFVWAAVSAWNISSYSSDVTDSSSVTSITKEWTDYNQSINSSINNASSTSVWTSSDLSDFKNYNWIANAYVIKNTNFIVWPSTFAWLTWPRTYIIENANLIINSNINYSGNIAFVVKWWNIQIDNSVTTISWTYISIPDGSLGWDIKWTSGSTNDVLTVKWSIYWNLENLLSKRTYIKENSWILSVWTIVSFGSSVFRDPAPLTSTFINEYLDATKVSK